MTSWDDKLASFCLNSKFGWFFWTPLDSAKHKASVTWQQCEWLKPAHIRGHSDPVLRDNRERWGLGGTGEHTPFLQVWLLLGIRDHCHGFTYHPFSAHRLPHFYTQLHCSLSPSQGLCPLDIRFDMTPKPVPPFISNPPKWLCHPPSCSSQEPDVTSWFLSIKKNG